MLAAVVAGFNSCKDDISLIADDGSIPDMTGEQVTFNTALSSAVESLSRSYIYDKNYENDSYKPINDAYQLKITMWQKQGIEIPVVGVKTIDLTDEMLQEMNTL